MLQKTAKGLVLHVKVTTKAVKSEFVSIENDALKLRLKAVPEKGKANKELIRFLSKSLSIPQVNFSIQRGDTSRIKQVLIVDGDYKAIHKALTHYTS